MFPGNSEPVVAGHESDYLQATVVKEALDQYASVFLISPVVIVRGVLLRKGAGASLLVEKAKTPRLIEFCAPTPVYPSPARAQSCRNGLTAYLAYRSA